MGSVAGTDLEITTPRLGRAREASTPRSCVSPSAEISSAMTCSSVLRLVVPGSLNTLAKSRTLSSFQPSSPAAARKCAEICVNDSVTQARISASCTSIGSANRHCG